MKTAIVIPSFRGAWRVQRLLESIARFDSDAYSNNLFYVFEDPSDDGSTERYHKVLDPIVNARFKKLDKWSNMHGAAMKAVASIDRSVYSWFLYLGDDLLATPGALSNVLHFIEKNPLKTVSLVGIPYWNAHDLTPEGYDGNGNRDWHPHGTGVKYSNGRPYLLTSKDDMYNQDPDWLVEVPRNHHWDGEGIARPYIYVNGAGFACKLETYDRVGGFAEGTWCLDESISVRTWLQSDQSICCLPGPPFVHYFGGATPCNPPQHDLHTEESWIKAMGMDKAEAGRLSYEKMFERESAVKAEMATASYGGAL
jgi:glycosyltransferase involved in cell wall biosynthesis